MPRVKKLSRLKVVVKRLRNFYSRATSFAKRKPFTSFLISLFFLFLAILANSLTAPKIQQISKKEAAKEVEVYRIGKAAKTSVLAKVEKAGVIAIVAQTSGVVSNIYVNEGETVWQGKTLVSLANNYAGENASSISRELAQIQYQNAINTYDQQKDLIGKQREIAQKSHDNSDELRSITDKSLSETRSLIGLNNNILSTIDANLSVLEGTNNDELILSTKQLKSQFLNGNNLLKGALRMSEYQSASDKPPAQLSDLQKDVALGQLDLQVKALDLSLEAGKLQIALAEVAEKTMFPVSPFGAVVERVFVSPGQSVNPGTPLVKLAGFKQEVNLVAKVPSTFARRVSNVSESIIHIDGKEFFAKPYFISHEATDGELYTILFTVPKEYYSMLTDGEYIRIELAIGVPDTGKAVPFVPIDSVFQTQDHAFVYVVDKDRAKSKNVVLGEVLGGEVEIDGLSDGDQVILNRNILAGDQITVKN